MMWGNDMYSTDDHTFQQPYDISNGQYYKQTIENICPPLPPGAVLLSDEIIDRPGVLPDFLQQGDHQFRSRRYSSKGKHKKGKRHRSSVDSIKFEHDILNELGFPQQSIITHEDSRIWQANKNSIDRASTNGYLNNKYLPNEVKTNRYEFDNEIKQKIRGLKQTANDHYKNNYPITTNSYIENSHSTYGNKKNSHEFVDPNERHEHLGNGQFNQSKMGRRGHGRSRTLSRKPSALESQLSLSFTELDHYHQQRKQFDHTKSPDSSGKFTPDISDNHTSSKRRYKNHDRRHRALSDNAINRKHGNLPVELKEHGLKDRTRPISSRKAIKITENLLCVPGIERIIEKRFYVKKESKKNLDNSPTQISEDNSYNQSTGRETANSDMTSILKEINQIRNDIQHLQLKHTELLVETRNHKSDVQSYTKTKDDAVVQTDMESDYSLQAVNGINYNNLQNERYLNASQSTLSSSDDTIPNAVDLQRNITNDISDTSSLSMIHKDVPVKDDDISHHTSIVTVTDQSDKNYSPRNSSIYSSSSELKMSNLSLKQNMQPRYENMEQSNKRVFKVEPPPSQIMQTNAAPPPHPSVHKTQQKNNQINAPVHLNLNGTPFMNDGSTRIMDYNWSNNVNGFGNDDVQSNKYNFQAIDLQQYHSNGNDVNIINNPYAAQNYSNAYQTAYLDVGGGDQEVTATMKSIPTTTLSYASINNGSIDNQYGGLTSEQPNNVFSLLQPSLSYKNNSFQIDSTIRQQPKNIAAAEYNLYGESDDQYAHYQNIAATRYNNLAESQTYLIDTKQNKHPTFDDLVQQYNSTQYNAQIYQGNQASATGEYNPTLDTNALQSSERKHQYSASYNGIKSSIPYENFIC